jgi:hypothetical protein
MTTLKPIPTENDIHRLRQIQNHSQQNAAQAAFLQNRFDLIGKNAKKSGRRFENPKGKQ